MEIELCSSGGVDAQLTRFLREAVTKAKLQEDIYSNAMMVSAAVYYVTL
jgi:hypothetical protein